MVRENVRFNEANFTSDGTYFYSMLDGSQVLQQKVDDGSVAFTYPLDTSVGGNVQELHWDGVNFWSYEDKTGGFIIRKWAIEAFICKQKQIINKTSAGVHTYSADAFAVEHYRLTVGVNDNGGGGYTFGLTDINISDTSMLEPGDVLTFVRKYTSTALRSGTTFVETVIVQQVLSSTQVRLTASMSGNPHGDGRGFRGPNVDIDLLAGTHPPTPDEVFVTKHLWVANNNSPNNPGTPALYKMRSSSGADIIQYSGTQYSSIGAMEFYTRYNRATGLDANQTKYNTSIVTDSSLGGKQTYVLIARSSALMFFNVNTAVVDRTMTMNNIKVDTVSLWSIFDMVVLGSEPDIVIYRLQNGTTYKNPSLNLTDEAWNSNFNYEKQLLRRVVSSISVTADPSIIPADGSSTASIVATLRDQYNDPAPAGKIVNWSDDSGGPGGGGGQGLFSTQTVTDSFGVARNIYKSGTTESDVKITASVQSGVI